MTNPIQQVNQGNSGNANSVPLVQSYLMNDDSTISANYVTNVSMSLSVAPTATPSTPAPQVTDLQPPYTYHLSAEDIARVNNLATQGKWDEIKQIFVGALNSYRSQLADAPLVQIGPLQSHVDALSPIENYSVDQIASLFGVTLPPALPAAPPPKPTIFTPYNAQPTDSIYSIISGNRKNALNELYDDSQFKDMYWMPNLNGQWEGVFGDSDVKELKQYADSNDVTSTQNFLNQKRSEYAAKANDPNSSLIEVSTYSGRVNAIDSILSTGNNVIGTLFTKSPSGFLLFNEQKWKDARDRLNKWNNLTSVLAKIVQSKGEGHNIVSQEMLSISGYTQMNIDQTVAKENEIFNKFADKKLSENLDAINNHNEKLSNDLKRIAKEEELNDPMTEFWTNLGGSLIAIVAAIFGGALSLGAAAVIASSSISAGASVAIQKFSSEDDIEYQKRLAKIDDDLAQVRAAQAQQNREDAQKIQNKKNEFSQMMQIKDQTGMIAAMALSLGIDIAMDGMNLGDVSANTANGYQELARAKVLKIQEKVRQLQSLMNHLKNLNQGRRKSRNAVHQEMTGAEGPKSSEGFEQAFQSEINQKLQLLTRKQQMIEQSINAFNQARRALEQAKKAEKSLEGRLVGSLMSGFLGGLVPIGGVGMAAASGVSGGVLNYEATSNAENSEKKFDPGQIDWTTASQKGLTQSDFDLETLLTQKQQQIGNQINLDVQSLLIQSMLDGTQNKNMTMNVSQDRQMFNGMAASAVQQKMETLNRLQNAFLALKENTLQSHNTVHSEMSDVAGEKNLTNTKAIYRSEYDLYLQNLTQKTAQVQEKINAHNQKAMDQMNIDKARFGILTSSVSGLFSGLGQGLTANSTTALRGVLGATEVAVSGLSDDLYDLSLANSDQNIGKGGYSDYRNASYENYQQIKNLNTTLDQMLNDLDPTHFEELVITDSSGRKVVDQENLMKKILKISQENILHRALTSLQKAKSDLRNMVHAEMTSHRGKNAGTLSEETITSEKKLASECLRRAGEQLQEIASLETRKADAVQNFNQQITRHGLAASTLALGSFAGSVSSLYYFQTASDLIGAGADLTFAAQEVEETTLREKINRNETVQSIIDKNQANNQDKALSRLERLEAELTLKLLDLKAKEGDFGVSTLNSASIAYARRMIEKIDNLKELYIRLRKEKAQARTLIKPGSALNGVAAEIAKDVNDYIKEIEQAINNENNTLSQQQNSRASRMYQKLSTVSNSTSQGLFSLGGSLNNKNALNFSNTQQLLRNLSTLRGSLHLSNQFLIKDYVTHQNKQSGIEEVDSDLATNAHDELAVAAKKDESEIALTQNALSLNGQISAMVFGAIFPLSSLLHETMNENQLINHYAKNLTEKRLASLRTQQSKLKQNVTTTQNLLEKQLSELQTLGQKHNSSLVPEIKSALTDLADQKTENLVKLSKTLNQINANQFGKEGQSLIEAIAAQTATHHQSVQKLKNTEEKIQNIQKNIDQDLAQLRTALSYYPKLSGKLSELTAQIGELRVEPQTLNHPLVKEYLKTKKEIFTHQKTIARLTQEIMDPDLETFLKNEDTRLQAGLQNYSKLAILLQAAKETRKAEYYAQNFRKLSQEISVDLIRIKNLEQTKNKLAEIEMLAKAGELIEDASTAKAQVVHQILDNEAILQMAHTEHLTASNENYDDLIKRLEKLYAGYSYMSPGYAQVTHSLYEKGKLNQLENEYTQLKKVTPVNANEKLALRRARTRYLVEKSKQLNKGDSAVAYERYQNYYVTVKKSQNAIEAEKMLDLALNELEAEL